MKITVDTESQVVVVDGRELPLYSDAAFELFSDLWVKVGWNQKYTYTFSWMGRPIIQLPEDVMRIQEVIYSLRPDCLIETGVAHGGSLILYASLFKAMGRGRVIGIDVEIRPANRKAIEEHELSSYISLVEGDSVNEETVAAVHARVQPGESVLVILDSCHSFHHVLGELEAYHALVTPGSYIVATDGIMRDLVDVPRGGRDWDLNNPERAARVFVERHPEFILEQPAWPFNESQLVKNVTHWPGAWLRRL